MSAEHDHITKLADDLVAKLGEHCDSVRVFLTIPTEGGETTSYSVGNGNIYAQIGLVKEWCVRQDEYVRSNARKEDESVD